MRLVSLYGFLYHIIMKKTNILDGLDKDVFEYYLSDLIKYLPDDQKALFSETKKVLNMQEYMLLLKQFINNNKLYTTLIKKNCTCIDSCDCEDDVYTEISKTTFDINNYKINITLLFANNPNIIKNDYNIKIFTFDQNDTE